jgi:hypothetical protein
MTGLRSVPLVSLDPVPVGRRRAVFVIPWPDPVLEARGVDPRSLYVELFWLPLIGPTATWLVRRLADGLDTAPEGFAIDPEETARSIGLGGAQGRRSPFLRAIDRAARYGLVRRVGPQRLAVRRRLATLPESHLRRLPGALQARHARWTAASPLDPAAERRYARLLAVDLTELGDDGRKVERRLTAWGVHPALAYDSAVWAAAGRASVTPRPTVSGSAEAMSIRPGDA